MPKCFLSVTPPQMTDLLQAKTTLCHDSGARMPAVLSLQIFLV